MSQSYSFQQGRRNDKGAGWQQGQTITVGESWGARKGLPLLLAVQTINIFTCIQTIYI